MKCLLCDVADVTMGQSPKSEFYNSEGLGMPFLQGNRTFGQRYPTFDTYTTMTTKIAKAGDIIMSVRAPVGDLNITPVDMCLGRGVCGIRMKNGNQDYLFYLLKYYLPQLLNIESGTIFGSVNRNDINGLEVNIIEDENEQKRIARMLTMLDDKIELNDAINKNLEQQTQAIFRSWFIDFAPFGGNAPFDWIKTTLGRVCSCELGGTPSRAKPEYWNGRIPWINSGEVNKFRITQPSETITELGLNKSATKLLPAKTIVIAITGATLGQVSLLEIESCANQSVVGVVPNPQLPYEFIYPFITANIHKLISHQTGGAQQHINKQNVESLPIVVPSEEIMKEYVELVGSLYASIANNCFENEHLADIRDSLLPRLMSGELDVSSIDL